MQAHKTTEHTYTFGETPIDVIKEAMGDEPYSMSLVGDDAQAVIDAVNVGIDAHLEALTSSVFEWEARKVGGRTITTALTCMVTPDDMLVLLRRLFEAGTDDAWSLRSGILTTLDIEEV